jgi:hypothetical protein
MSTEKTRWFAVGVPVLVLVGVGIAAGLRMSVGIPWGEIVLPIIAFVGLQVATYAFMFWARDWRRTRDDYRPAIALAGLYCWASGWLVVHYGIRWSLLRNHSSDDLIAFSVFMIVVVAITFGLFSLFKGRRKSTR